MTCANVAGNATIHIQWMSFMTSGLMIDDSKWCPSNVSGRYGIAEPSNSIIDDAYFQFFCLENRKNTRKEIVIHGDRIILCATFRHFISHFSFRFYSSHKDLWLAVPVSNGIGNLIQSDALSRIKILVKNIFMTVQDCGPCFCLEYVWWKMSHLKAILRWEGALYLTVTAAKYCFIYIYLLATNSWQ